MEVTFEPSYLGETQSTLSISSTTGGDYVIPLFGLCLPPKPQGPFVIKPGHSVSIPFKNVFPQLTQFKFCVDNPAFVVKSGDTIKAKKVIQINVAYEGKHGEINKVGKLTVSSVQSKGKGSTKCQICDVSWVFYLKGGQAYVVCSV